MRTIVQQFNGTYETTVELNGFAAIAYSPNPDLSKAKAIGMILNKMAKRKKMMMGVERDLRGRKKQNI